MNARAFFLVVSPLVLLAAGLGFLAAEARARPRAPTIYWQEDVVREMRSLVEESYVDDVPADRARAMFYEACKGYMRNLDPYCEFYTPGERKSLEEETVGEFGGVGILGQATPNGLVVRGVRRGDPAHGAGIRPGDRIVEVDGRSLEGGAADDLLPRLKGEPGTAVRVAWLPAGEGTTRREATVTRALVKIDSVLGVHVADAEAGIGYLRVGRFQENTAKDVRSALGLLRKQGARSFVLDLRGDLGGVLDAAVATADAFLASGVLVVTRGRDVPRTAPPEARAEPGDETAAPLLVLVDGSTASAAEVLAGALQDHRRAFLVGERTYGKFLVQRIVNLDREGVAVRLTTARYFTPWGRNLQRDDSRGVRGGLVPDEPVAVGDSDRDALQRALDDQVGLDWDLVPGTAGTAPQPGDPVLDRAVRLLRSAARVAGSPAPAPGPENK